MPGVPINSLQDLLMLRELKKQDLESRPLFSAMKALSDGVALGIAEQQEKAKQKKKMEDTLSMIKQSQNTNNSKITIKANDKGEVDYTITQGNDEEDSYKKESLRLRQERLDQEVRNEKRRTTTSKLVNARAIGGVLGEEEMNTLSEDIGFDLGTDLNTGRVEKTGDGKYRILSNEEFSKKSDIIKNMKDAESGLNIVLGDVGQIERMFDAVSPNLKGPVEGRLKAPVQGFLGNTGVRVYDDVVKAFVGNISRSILLEKGVLTNADVDRARGLLPRLEDTEEIKNRKIAEIKNLLATRYEEYKRRQEVGNIDSSETSKSENKIGRFTVEVE